MTRRVLITAIVLALLSAPPSARAGDEIPFKPVPSPDGSVTISDMSDSSKTGTSCEPTCAADCEPCCGEACVRSWRAFGEVLCLRPGGDKVAYATPINSAFVRTGNDPVQVGTEAVADNGFHPGFRVGLVRGMANCAEFGLTYSYFDGTAHDGALVRTPIALRSLVYHPGTATTPTNFLQAAAALEVQFQLADVDYRRTFACDDSYALNYVVGFRYGHLRQDFRSQFGNLTTTENVNSDIIFDGAGIRLGLEGERYACHSGLLLYAKAFANFLGGVERARYTQHDTIHGTVVDTGWDEDRIVSILDLELGLGWTNRTGRVRVTTGYLVSAWLNTIDTRDFIRAVQTNTSNSSQGLNNALTFDGITTRFEYRF